MISANLYTHLQSGLDFSLHIGQNGRCYGGTSISNEHVSCDVLQSEKTRALKTHESDADMSTTGTSDNDILEYYLDEQLKETPDIEGISTSPLPPVSRSKKSRKKKEKISFATSLSRATSFNRHNVVTFFANLASAFDRFKFQCQDIYNFDETRLTTVQKPRKIIATKGTKRVGAVTSAEKGTLCGQTLIAQNALQNCYDNFTILYGIQNTEQRLGEIVRYLVLIEEVHVNPQKIKPFPESGDRKVVRKRKPMVSAILTDSHGKNDLQIEAAIQQTMMRKPSRTERKTAPTKKNNRKEKDVYTGVFGRRG
ncbi:hypothetical protein AVEN_108348-1 [Araneus ventricosus]|uniref:Uncharacterized protein n=1 Tax=Araneus ventricosus TaxID=182803 RepID=A0A4Y2CV39_ARAVE|nr:hypothetical protein AVEN_108348-1 [Araneus ventricosus]